MPPINQNINLHPKTHPPSALQDSSFDVICLGSGWAGRILAARCVAAGLTALIVEKELVGGDCPFWACVPSKALLRSAEALNDARHVGGAREQLTRPDAEIEADATFRRRDMYTSDWDDTKVLIPMVEKSGVHIVRGFGQIRGIKKVNVTLHVNDGPIESIDVEARQAVAICTGSEAVFPNIPGLLESKPWSPREASSSSSSPKSMVIVGGGVVGVEMATIYSRLGTLITLCSRSPRLLSSLDDQAGELVRERLEASGKVRVLLSTEVVSVQSTAQECNVTVVTNGCEHQVSTSQILVATGRRAVTQDLGIESVGYDPALLRDGSPLKVDDSLLLCGIESNSTPWLYAAGDVNGRAMLTHTSKYHGRIASNAIIARARGKFPHDLSPFDSFSASADHTVVPQVIFTDPTVASVGLTHKGAKRIGQKVRVVTAPVQTLGAMLHAEGYNEGWAQWILHKDTGVLLGATFVGSSAAELLHASTVAIVGGMSVEQLVHAIPPFPTMSEVYLNLVNAAGL